MHKINKGININLPYEQVASMGKLFSEWKKNNNDEINLIIVLNPDEIIRERFKFFSNIIFITFDYSENDIELLVEDYSKNIIDYEIQRIGIASNSKGYKYLKEAVKLVLKDPELISAMTKELYPTIAKMHSVSSNSVEKAIRTSINVAWGKGSTFENSLVSEELFYFVVKPKNSELISVIAERIRCNYASSKG